MNRKAGMRRVATLAGFLALLLVQPVAAAVVGTHAPGAADRAALTLAFKHAHPSRAHLKLAGLRVTEDEQGGAAYYFTTGAGGAYAKGDLEFYKRVARHRWTRASRLKVRHENGLHPLFLWKVESDGSGTWVFQTTSTDSEGNVNSDRTEDHFSWQLRFGSGRAGSFGPVTRSDSAATKISVQTAQTVTSTTNPAENRSCHGTLVDRGFPTLSTLATGRGYTFDLELADELTGGVCGAQFDQTRLVARVKATEAAFGDHVAPIAAHFDSSNPALAGAVMPHRGETTNNGDVRSSYSDDLTFSGTLRFTLTGVALPHGALSAPDVPGN